MTKTVILLAIALLIPLSSIVGPVCAAKAKASPSSATKASSTTTPSATAEKFDYSKYLAPKAWAAIQASQGVLCIAVPTFSSPGFEMSMMQALVVDVPKGLILSVAHGISEYQEVAFGEDTKYIFIFRDIICPLELRAFSRAADLALFKVRKGSLAGSKAAVFAEKVQPFEEHYSFRYKVQYGPSGFIRINDIPWKAHLVEKYDQITTIPLNPLFSLNVAVEVLVFDRSLIYGFSGGGVFNGRGEVVGIISRSVLPGGFSESVSMKVITEFIEKNKGGDSQRGDKSDKSSKKKK